MNGSPLTGARVLVTGGAGFIGSHLVEALCRAGAVVRVLDDFSTGRIQHLAAVADRVEIIEGDIRNLARCREACRGAHYVFHLAALGSVPRSLEDPAESIAVNVAGTANVFAAARDAGTRRVVYASSSSVYGDSTASPKREGEEGRVLSPYAASKGMDEELGRLFADCFAFESIALRFFNVYGPRQNPNGAYAAVIPRFFSSLLCGRPVTVYGDGFQSRDFTFVGDAVSAVLAAAAASPAACGRAYNVGSGASTTLLDLERAIRELVGGGPPPQFAPSRPGDVKNSLAATDDALRAFGYRARVELRQGLESCLAFYRESHGWHPGEAPRAAGWACERPAPFAG